MDAAVVGAPPQLRGWAAAATAIRAVRRIDQPVLLSLDVDDYGTITVDLARHAYDGGGMLADLPVDPATVRVETRTVALESSPEFDLPGRTLDPLLWLIGRHAFGPSLAPWLHDDSRYRLRRWPNLAELTVPLDQVRLIAMLGNTFATVDELAATAGIPVEVARQTLNACSVLGILRRQSDAAGPATASPAAAGPAPRQVTPASAVPAASTGLFARLRERLGR
jgi:hypothetical protein